jgi:hypothetical protein
MLVVLLSASLFGAQLISAYANGEPGNHTPVLVENPPFYIPEIGTVVESAWPDVETLEATDAYTTGNLKVSAPEVRISKELDASLSKNDVTYFGELIDERGNFIDDNSYVYVTVLLANTANEEFDFGANLFSVVSLDENDLIVDMASELRYRSFYNPERDPNGKGYYHIFLDPNEEAEYLLVYILKDSTIEEQNLAFILLPNVIESLQDTFKAFRITL